MSRKKPESKQISQEWLTTYSDMMTLILTFFVLLYSFSLVDQTKFKSLAQSLAIALGGTSTVVTNGGNIGPVPSVIDQGNAAASTNSSAVENKKTEQMYKEVSDFIKANDLDAKVTLRHDRRGVLIELQENILFDSGKAQIKQDSMPILEKISEMLKKFPNEVTIEGHTDNLPINKGYYQSNWELSSDRAVKVLRYFTDTKGMDGKRFNAVGYGEFRPIASNNTPEGRQTNRRVNILILTYDE